MSKRQKLIIVDVEESCLSNNGVCPFCSGSLGCNCPGAPEEYWDQISSDVRLDTDGFPILCPMEKVQRENKC